MREDDLNHMSQMNKKPTSQSPDWKSLIDDGVVEAAVRGSTRLADAALQFGSTASALRSAWQRHADSTQRLKDLVGADLGTDIDPELDPDICDIDDAYEPYESVLAGELRLKSKGQTIQVPQRTIAMKPAYGEKWLIPGDIHFGIQDDRSISLMVRCAEIAGVDRVILNGDAFDCYGISRHPKTADRIRGGNWTLADEKACASEFLSWVGATRLPSIFMPGNHEDRLWRLMDENPALEGTLLPKTVFDIPDSVICTERNTRLRADSLVIEHGHNLRGSTRDGGMKGVLMRHPDQTTICGHSHKVASYGMTTYDRHERPCRHEAITIGHLSLPEKHIDYAGSDMNWQQAFAIVTFWEGRGGKLRYEIDVVQIHDHEFSYQGRVYR